MNISVEMSLLRKMRPAIAGRPSAQATSTVLNEESYITKAISCISAVQKMKECWQQESLQYRRLRTAWFLLC